MHPLHSYPLGHPCFRLFSHGLQLINYSHSLYRTCCIVNNSYTNCGRIRQNISVCLSWCQSWWQRSLSCIRLQRVPRLTPGRFYSLLYRVDVNRTCSQPLRVSSFIHPFILFSIILIDIYEVFPLDGRGRNDHCNDAHGKPHNFAFCFESHSRFTFRKEMSFTVTTSESVFVYVNDILTFNSFGLFYISSHMFDTYIHLLVIDLGSIHPTVTRKINYDGIVGLQEGQTYQMDFFFCERYTTDSGILCFSLSSLRSPSTLNISFDYHKNWD